VLVGPGGGDAAPGGALQVAVLDEVRLVHVLDGAGLLSDGGGQGVEPHRAPLEAVDDVAHEPPVHLVEALGVDAQGGEGLVRDLLGDAAVAQHVGEVAQAPQQPVGHPGGAPGPGGDLPRPAGVQVRVKAPCGALDDLLQLRRLVVVEPGDVAEAVPQRAREEAAPGGGPHQREAGEGEGHGAGVGPVADDHVEAELLHGRVQVLFNGGGEPVHLVDEEDVPRLEAGEDAGEVALLLQRGPGGQVHLHPHLGGDDVGQGGLAEAGRSAEEEVVHRLAAALGRLHEDLEVVLHLGLADVLVEAPRAEGRVHRGVLRPPLSGQVPVAVAVLRRRHPRPLPPSTAVAEHMRSVRGGGRGCNHACASDLGPLRRWGRGSAKALRLRPPHGTHLETE
jgi:hypothetical protein